MFYKTEQITIRVNPILKDKFTVALGFRSFADFFTAEMQKLVRDYEKQI
jgi:sarcosine oxidase gamma subunit